MPAWNRGSSESDGRTDSWPDVTPKVLGADVELGNYLRGVEATGGTGPEAARRLLSEIRGVPSRGAHGCDEDERPVNPLDRDRRFLPANAGCAYIDSDHLEIALPETLSAFDHVAYWRAMLLVARRAMRRTNRRSPGEPPVEVLVNCSDGLGHSYGSHVSVLLSRTAWENIFHRRPHYLAYLAAFQVSSIVFTGQGKVGRENGRTEAPYQLSQRADFMERLVSDDTMHQRPIVNSRNEPLCGRQRSWDGDRDLARLHVIFFDSTLCQVATLLRAGTLQLVAAMIEAGHVDARLTLDDPLDALDRWSADPELAATASLTDGTDVTAVDLQRRFLDCAATFARSGRCRGTVEKADEILSLWADTLDRLAARDFATLGRRLDWVLKRQILQRAMAQRSLTWGSPEIKHLDQLYSSLDEERGLFWACERAEAVDRVVTDHAIARAGDAPPEDTRAWMRAQLLRRAGVEGTEEVDWDLVCLRLPSVRDGGGGRRCRVHLPLPYSATRSSHGRLFAGNPTLEQIVDRLGRAADHDVARTRVRIARRSTH